MITQNHKSLTAAGFNQSSNEEPVDRSAQLLASSEEKQALEECLSRLPPDKRAAVLGRFFSELAYEDLSAELQENGDTIRIRVGRALPELRSCLESKGVAL